MEYTQIARVGDVSPNTMIKVRVGETDVLLANVGGAYFALNNKCPHMGGSLVGGKLVDAVITCPRHGSQFDVRTGKAVGDPHLLFIKMKTPDATAYAVKIEGEAILVGL